MKKVSTALALLSVIGAGSLLAEGCSKGSETEYIFVPQEDAGTESGPAPETDAGAGTVDAPVDTGPVFGSDDAATDAYYFLDSGCATATAVAKRDPVFMLIVLDGSGSMGEDNKWSAVIPALDAIFDDLLSKADPTFGAGLHVFSDSKDPTGGSGPYPANNDVFIGFVDQSQHDSLRARIDGAQPSGGTPTHKALIGAYARLENLVPFAPLPPTGRKVLVLMTDGVPNGDNTTSQQEQQACLDLADTELKKNGPAGPISTFSVGIGPFPSPDPGGYDPVFMGHLAKAGGTSPLNCDPNETTNLSNICHFQIDPTKASNVAQLTKAFIDAINKIRSQVTSCTFDLEKPDGGGAIDPHLVNVVFTDGNGNVHVIPEDPQNGWRYDDPTNPKKVILNGGGCDEVKLDSLGKLSIILGCKSITK
jgi:hypothetical protein